MKKLFLFVFMFLVLVSAAGIYTMTRYNIENLIVCSTNEKASYIPAFACETYLYHFRGHGTDLAFMKKRTGLNFLVNVEDPLKRRRLFEFFIGKGMDVNAVSNIDGLTPLHAAILLNDHELVHFLLKNGANKLVRERTNGLTPLEFLGQMDAQFPGIDRSRLRQALEQ